MKMSTSIDIAAPKEKVWDVITNIDGSAETITGIVSLEVLERPDSGLVGLKWKETRKMFGREAEETMWITDAVENKSYRVRAENHGVIYISDFVITPRGDQSTLSWTFAGTPQTFMAKLMGGLMGWMMKGSMKKMLLKDLEDIKKAAEAA